VTARGEVLRDGFPPDLVRAYLELAQLYVQLNQAEAATRHIDLARRLWRGEPAARLLAQAEAALTAFPDRAPNR
jgi:hypothetical protein